MKLYNVQEINHYQVWSKYCNDLDNSINAIVNYIDLFCPNYRILNLPNKDNLCYLSNDQLHQADILEFGDTPDGHIYVNLGYMKPHNVLDNTFQEEIGISGSYTWAQTVKIPQGYALRHDGYDSEGNIKYSIVSLASSGSYYVIDSFTITNIDTANSKVTTQLTWRLVDNATDIYGKNYLFSLTLPGSRFYYHGAQNNISLELLGESPFITANFANSPANPKIATSKQGLWTHQHILMSEIEQHKDDNVEEVFGDTLISIEETRIGEYPQSRYTINTDIQNFDNDIYVNFY